MGDGHQATLLSVVVTFSFLSFISSLKKINDLFLFPSLKKINDLFLFPSQKSEPNLNIFTTLLFIGDLISSIGHLLSIISFNYAEICFYQSQILQFSSILSIWTRLILVISLKYDCKILLNIGMRIFVIFIAIFFAILPANSFGETSSLYRGFCWLKGESEGDHYWRWYGYYCQLLALFIISFYIRITNKTYTYTSKEVKQFSYAFCNRKIIINQYELFAFALIGGYILPAITRSYQYLYPLSIPSIYLVIPTKVCISSIGVFDAIIYDLKYDNNNNKFHKLCSLEEIVVRSF
eukprot:90663_1